MSGVNSTVGQPQTLPELGMEIPPGFSLDGTLGAPFLGVIGAAILFGITNLQIFIYYQNYPNDRRFYKYMVGLLWLLDAFHLALTIHGMYFYLVSSFGKLASISRVVWSLQLQITINVIIILSVQSLYAERVWKLGQLHNHKWLPLFAVIVVAGGYAIGIILAYKTWVIGLFSELYLMAWVIILSFALSTFIDVVITGCMCFYLQRSRSGFSQTNTRLGALIRFVCASGLATTLCSLAALITYAAMPNQLIFYGIEFLLTKLYVNSFLAMLNARNGIRGRDDVTQFGSVGKGIHVHSSGNGTPVIEVITSRVVEKDVPMTPLRAKHSPSADDFSMESDWRGNREDKASPISPTTPTFIGQINR